MAETEATVPTPTFSADSKMWRVSGLGGVELLRASQQTHTFPRHTHEGYAVGVIEQGALGFFYRGENVVTLNRAAVGCPVPPTAPLIPRCG